MKKKMVSVLLAAAMGTTALVGFGTTAYADDDVLEFYHGYYQDESEWAAAQVMRDIYDEFAKEHADGSVTFKPMAARMAHMKKVLVPDKNRPDMAEISKEITKGMEIVFVKTMDDVVREVFV